MAEPVKLNLPGRRRFGPAIAAGVVGAALLGLASLWLSLTTYVEPDEFAVRQVYFGPGQGVQEGVFGPGLHVVIPGYERIHKFPRDIQVLDMNNSEMDYQRTSRIREDYKVAPAIRIQTSEGYQVTVDVTVLYRVKDPYTVVTKVGGGRIYETKVVARRADKILRQTLGQLNAEDFYSDKIRIAKAEDARQALTEDLDDWGIQVWGVLIRHYTYDQRYQQAIEEKKIQDQRVFKNQAEGLQAQREAERERVLAEGRATIDVELERAKAEVRKIRADGDSYSRKRIAEGDLLVALAEAEGTRLENAALQQAGASNMVGLEMAEALQGTELIMVSTNGVGGVNPLDLDKLLQGW